MTWEELWRKLDAHGSIALYGLKSQRDLHIPPGSPEGELIEKRRAADPAVLSAKQNKMVLVRIGEIKDMPGVRAEKNVMPCADRAMRSLHK